MCGVAGIIAPFASPAWRRETLSRLLRAAQTRGNDATGIAFIDPKEGLKVIKQAADADDFTKSEEYLKGTKNLPPIVIGHTRSATGGTAATEKKNENNHPFYSLDSGIAVIHNGVVNDTAWRKTVGLEGGIKKEFVSGTDSEVFLRLVESMMDDGSENPSMENAIYDACYNISGTYALAFIRQSEPNKLWFGVHTNPLAFGYNLKEKYIVFASTENIIENAMAEYKWMLDFFYAKTTPKIVVNQLKDDFMMTIKLTNEEPHFILTPRQLKIHPGSYSSYGKQHRHKGGV